VTNPTQARLPRRPQALHLDRRSGPDHRRRQARPPSPGHGPL